MKPKYHVVTVYEGQCPTCKQYQNSQLSPESVDKECTDCKRKRIIKAITNKKITITDIDGNFISGYSITIKSKDKTYVIEANKFDEIISVNS